MVKRSSKKAGLEQPRDRLLPKLTMAFFDRPLLTGFIWLSLVAMGIASYTTLLKREGFPSVNIPIAFVSGTYYVNDPAKVDRQVAKPISDIASGQDIVKTVQTQSADNFFNIQIQYADGTDAQVAANTLKTAVESSHLIPKNASIQYNVPYFGATGGDIEQIDEAISFLASSNKVPVSVLAAKAESLVKALQAEHLPLVKDVFVKQPFETVTDPATGKLVSVQHSFDRFGIRRDEKTDFYDSVLVGIAANKGADVIKLDEQVKDALAKIETQPQFQGYEMHVSASFAPSIKENLSELQRVLLEGLLAVLVVGSIVIAIRASFITVISMVTVLLTTLGFLYLIGYSLNVITLFALILGLALIVDDTIIMVEAIDSARRKQKDRRLVVLQATRKISRAMVAATLTAALSFLPLAFVSGILGSFIRAIPITLVASLIISLFVALIFIPFFARFLLLSKKQLSKKGPVEIAAGFEAKLAHFITRPMQWARHSRKKLGTVIGAAVLVGIGFVVAGLVIAQQVVFNIFPPTKDTNGLVLSIDFPPGVSIETANKTAAHVDEIAAGVIGPEFVESSYYNSGTAQSASEQIQITPYGKRDISSPEIVKQLQERFDSQFKQGRVTVGQLDIGPPSAAFIVQINAENRPAAYRLAKDLSAYLSQLELKRPSGKVAHMVNVSVSTPSTYIRSNGKPIVTVSAGFDGNDTTTLVTLAQDAVKKDFPPEKLAEYNLPSDALSFDIGQESENQESFKTLALAFPVLLLAMFVLLAIQFRSFLQPLLIFLAIPFSIFGIMLGLFLTNNAISFFAMLGFFALIGLSIKNTILLTDYANQARRAGMEPIDAAKEALEERFRPLFATSMTAVVSLIPLAISSPFWQGLAVVLIFGLLSSTFLVITVFPYYYLAAEYARLRIRARSFLLWLLVTVVVTIVVSKLIGVWALLVPVFSLYLVVLQSFFKRRQRRQKGVA